MRNEYYHFSVVNRLFYSALHIVVICVLFFVGTMPLSAQIFSTAQSNRYETSYPSEYGATQQNAYSAHEAQANYNSYQSTVYQPFESSAPSCRHSTYSTSSYSNSGSYNPIRGRRNTGEEGGTDANDPDNDPGDGELPENWFDPDHPSDPGHQSNQSPVGEAWVMLLFAAAAALAIYIRQRKAVLRG